MIHIISYSELNSFSVCPLLFKFIYSKEKFTDKIFRVTKKLTMSQILDKNIVSFDSEPQINPIISASSFATFKDCKQRFIWKYRKEKETDPVFLTPFMFGTLVHTKFDAFVAAIKEEKGSLLNSDFTEEFKKFYKSEELNSYVKDYLKKYLTNEKDRLKEYKAFYKAITNHYSFINSILKQGCEPQFNFWFGNKKSPIALEIPEISSLRFVGEIDHYYINKRGNITIEDTKTSSSVYYLNNDQLFLYAFCLEQFYKNRGQNLKVDELNFNLVRLGKRHSIPFGVTQKQAFISRLSSLESCFQLDHFPQTKSKNCVNCPYRTKCREQNSSIKEREFSSLSEMLKRNIENLKDI